MEYRKLNTTGIDVSAICLGTMTWGEQNSEADAHEQLEYAISQGVNFIDTAEMYPVYARPETQGRTETYIGTWLQKRQKRDDLIIASKVASRSSRTDFRGMPTRASKEQILEAIDTTLLRLQTDYIDLYQLHWPDRNTNFFGEVFYEHDPYGDEIDLEEQLDAMREIIKAGKSRFVGLSNETPWGVMHALELAKTKDLPRIVTVQNPYNLLQRVWDIGLSEVSIREDVGLLAYSPLAGGVLTGKYRNGQDPEGSRKLHFPGHRESRYHTPRAYAATEKYAHLAEKLGLSLATLSLAFVNSRIFTTANIIGATSLAQLKEDISSIDVKLSEDVQDEIKKIFYEDALAFNLGTWN